MKEKERKKKERKRKKKRKKTWKNERKPVKNRKGKIENASSTETKIQQKMYKPQSPHPTHTRKML